MRKIVFECDLCGAQINDANSHYRIKVKSNAFITYSNYDCIGSDRRTVDICGCCIENIKKYCTEMREHNEDFPKSTL